MIRIGLIGFGRWGENLARGLVVHRDFEFVSCTDYSLKRQKEIRRLYPQVEPCVNTIDLLDSQNVEAVVIATPAITHFEIAKAAIMRGKHVLVEKPIALKSNEVETLIEMAMDAEVTLMTDYILLYAAPVKEMIRLSHSGSLGKLFTFRTSRMNLGYFREDVNVVWDLMPHELSILDAITEEEPIVKWTSSFRLPGYDKVCATTVSLVYPSGLNGDIHVSWFAPEKVREMTLCGSKRMLVYNDLDNAEPLKIFNHKVSTLHGDISCEKGEISIPSLNPREPLQGVYDEFYKMISEKAVDDERNMRVTHTIQAIQMRIDSE